MAKIAWNKLFLVFLFIVIILLIYGCGCNSDEDKSDTDSGKKATKQAAPTGEETKPSPKPPSISPRIPDIDINEDSPPSDINLANHMQAGDGKSLKWAVTGVDPAKLKIGIDSGNKAKITLMPNAIGETSVTFTLTDQNGLSASQSVRIFIKNVQDPPKITSQPVTTAKLNEQYQYQVTVEEVDGEKVSYSLARSPPGMTIDNNGLIKWKPNQLGDAPVLVKASDGTLTAQQEFTISVTE